MTLGDFFLCGFGPSSNSSLIALLPLNFSQCEKLLIKIDLACGGVHLHWNRWSVVQGMNL